MRPARRAVSRRSVRENSGFAVAFRVLGYAPPIAAEFQEYDMGKGDKKTAKGKRNIASYGNARSHSATKKPMAAVKKAAPAAVKAPAAKKAAPAKKKA